jgi:hypothetical protein
MRILVIVGLLLSLSGCFTPEYKVGYAKAAVLEEQAAILKLYRGCLEKYQDDPAKAKANCEHYTQALHSVDVRGMK